MNTEQKYAENPANFQFIDLTAKQPVNQDTIQPDPADETSFPVAAFDVDAQIHEVIDRFVGEMNSIDNVEVLHELFYAWLSHKKIDKRKTHQNYISVNTLRIIGFLTQLHELWTAATVAAATVDKKVSFDATTSNEAAEGLDHE